jgi:hypothetical protein
MHTGGVVLGTGAGAPGAAQGSVVLGAGAAAGAKFGGPKARVNGQARAERGLSVVATRAAPPDGQGRQVPKHRMPKAPPVGADDVRLSRQERGDMFAAAFERKFAAAALVAPFSGTGS